MALHFLNDAVNDVKSTEPCNPCKLINRIPGLHLLISSLPGSASTMHVEFNKHSQSLA